MSDELDYVADFLKTQDRDRYFASLVLPDQKRGAVQALYAFNADIAAISERVSEPGPGEIRLQWWKDALEGVSYGGVQQNPIAAAFLSAMEDFDLPSGPLVRLIAARRFDLYQDPMPDMETFEGYAGETNSTLYQFAAMILNEGQPLEDGDASGHLGVAHALIGHMRALGYNAARGRIFLPWTIFAANGVTEQQLFARHESEGVRTSLAQFTEIAAEHLEKARTAIAAAPKPVRPVFASIAILQPQLKALQKAAADPSIPVLSTPAASADWLKIARLVYWSFTNA